MTWVAVGLVVALGVWVIVTYNRLVARRNRVEEAWSGIDVQLQRRADLVPSLVETVRGYAQHEDALFRRVTEARARVVGAADPRAAERADRELDAALGRLFAVAEAYPELEASGNFLALQRELAELEEELSFARRYHNAVVEEHNTGIQRVPTVLLARPFGFSERPYFRAGEDARARPDVRLEG